MSNKINYTLAVQVEGGPSFTTQQQITEDEYGVLQIRVPTEASKEDNEKKPEQDAENQKAEEAPQDYYALASDDISVAGIMPEKKYENLSLSIYAPPEEDQEEKIESKNQKNLNKTANKEESEQNAKPIPGLKRISLDLDAPLFFPHKDVADHIVKGGDWLQFTNKGKEEAIIRVLFTRNAKQNRPENSD